MKLHKKIAAMDNFGDGELPTVDTPATLDDLKAAIAEHEMVVVPKHDLKRLYNTGYCTAQMQGIVDQLKP